VERRPGTRRGRGRAGLSVERMRIAYVSEVWAPSINGIVTRLSATIDELIAAGHEILMIAPRTGRADATVPHRDHLQVVRVPAISFPFVYGGQPWGLPVPTVRTALRRFGPDLVHLVNPVLLGMAGTWAARSLHVPLVASFHTDVPSYARSYHIGWIAPLCWRVVGHMHRRARLNLVTSRYSARLLASHGVPDAQLWRRGVGAEFVAAGEAGPRRRSVGSDSGEDGDRTPGSITDGEHRVVEALYVGRLADEKGLAKLLPLAHSGRARIVLVGDGPDKARLQQRFAGTRTVFRGTLTGADLVEAYRSADVFVFPSTTETLGLVILEALATGLPVVASESPASNELLRGSAAARLVPDGQPDGFTEAVGALLASAPPDVMHAQARAEATGWDWKSATDELASRYAAVVEAHALTR